MSKVFVLWDHEAQLPIGATHAVDCNWDSARHRALFPLRRRALTLPY
jgi:hypothetical protein